MRIKDFINHGEEITAEIKPDLIKLICVSKPALASIFVLTGFLIAKFNFDISLKFILIPLIMVAIGIIPALIKYSFTTYYLTNEKIIIETGVIGRDYDIVKLNRILDINVDVTTLDVILGTGSIKLCTANDTESIKLEHIRQPKKLVRSIRL